MHIHTDIRWFFLPYCIRPLGDDCYVILNRYYKPLGHLDTSDLPQEEYDALLRKFSIKIPHQHPASLQALHWDAPREDGDIFLYSGNGFRDRRSEKAYMDKVDSLITLVCRR